MGIWWVEGPLARTAEPQVYSPGAKEAYEGGVKIVVVHSDPHLLERWAVKEGAPNWRFLSDDELLDGLASHGVRAGLAVVDGREVLVALGAKLNGIGVEE